MPLSSSITRSNLAVSGSQCDPIIMDSSDDSNDISISTSTLSRPQALVAPFSNSSTASTSTLASSPISSRSTLPDGISSATSFGDSSNSKDGSENLSSDTDDVPLAPSNWDVFSKRAMNYTLPPHHSGGGIINFSFANTCYVNATLQLLLGLPPLMRLCHEHACNRAVCLACSLSVLANTISLGDLATSLEFLSAFHIRCPGWVFERQEDAHEFLVLCLGELVTDLDAGHLFTARVDEVICCDACGTPRPPNANPDNEVSTIAILRLPADEARLSVLSCINYRVETAALTVHCDHCNIHHSPSSQSFAWNMIGNVLILRITRELSEGGKDSRPMKVDQRLSITLGNGTIVRCADICLYYPY